MAHFSCHCGHIFSNAEGPNDSMHVVRDEDMDEYCRHVWRTYQLCDIERGGMLPEGGTQASADFHESMYASMDLEGEMWECPQCGRIYWRRPGEERFRTYLPTSPE
jgi:rubredoxin